MDACVRLSHGLERSLVERQILQLKSGGDLGVVVPTTKRFLPQRQPLQRRWVKHPPSVTWARTLWVQRHMQSKLSDSQIQIRGLQQERDWQLKQMTTDVRAALRTLPLVGEDRSGPLGPGLLASGQIGMIIRDLQADISRPDQ
jgi:hypothetical protein